MKRRLKFDPVFDPAARTLNFSGLADFDIKNLVAVINIRRKAIIYAIGQPNKGFSAFSTSTLTLDYDTTTHQSTDELHILYASQGPEEIEDSFGISFAKDKLLVTAAYTTAQAVANQDLLTNTLNGWLDVSQYNSGSIQIITTSTITAGAIIFEQSNFNTASSGKIQEVVESGGFLQNTAQTIAANANRLFIFPIKSRYIRVRVSTAFAGTGTITIAANLSQLPYTNVQTSIVQNNNAALGVVLNTGSNTIGNVTANAGTNLIGDVGLQVRANATGAATIRNIVSAATTNAVTVKGSAGRLFGWSLANTTATWAYVKLHNVTTVPVAGTTAVVLTIAIPPNGVSNQIIPVGLGFGTGIGMTIVTGSADNDATAVALGQVVGNLAFA